MRVSSHLPSFTPISRNLPKIQKGPEKDPPEPPSYFMRNFTSRVDSASYNVANVLYPLNCSLVAGRIAGGLAGAYLGPAGSMLGGIGGSMLGYRFGAQTKDKVQRFVDNLGGNSKAGQAAVRTLYAGAMGAVITGVAMGGVAPGPMAVGAGVTVAGLAGYSAWKARG